MYIKAYKNKDNDIVWGSLHLSGIFFVFFCWDLREGGVLVTKTRGQHLEPVFMFLCKSQDEHGTGQASMKVLRLLNVLYTKVSLYMYSPSILNTAGSCIRLVRVLATKSYTTFSHTQGVS